jgi:hypothetical protein
VAAASKILDKRAYIDSIMRAECWKSKKVFNSFYNRANFPNIANLLTLSDQLLQTYISIGVFLRQSIIKGYTTKEVYLRLCELKKDTNR